MYMFLMYVSLNMNFSMENFRAQDTFKWGDTEITRSASDRRMEQQYVTGNHHVPMIVDFRKRGVEVRGIRSKLLKNKR